jgi:TolB-like protein
MLMRGAALTQGNRTLMRRSLAALVAGLALVLGAERSDAETRTRLAILPIVVHSLEQREYLQAGLADMLASRLGRVPDVAVIRVEGKDQATTDVEVAKAAGRKETADYVLFGSFTHFGEGASLDLQCVPVSADAFGGPRSIFIQSGTLGEIIPRLDQVVARVGRYLAVGAAEAGAASGGLPSVDAAGPLGDSAAPGEMLQDVLSEIEALRGRVDALEQRVFSTSVEAVPEVDLGNAPEVFESDPNLHWDLR